MNSPMETSNFFTPPCSPVSDANGSLDYCKGKMKKIPVRTGQDTADWLQLVICPLPSKPSADLEKFLSLGNGSRVNEVISRANKVLEAIFPSSEMEQKPVNWSLLNVNFMDSLWSGAERIEAMKLYYKVLESICASEAKKLSAADLSCLLINEKFHRCMLACAAELVSVAHIRISILFPLVLERTGITAFDMSKVIESFIKHEDSLPRKLKRHLNSIEEKLLASMVWEKGSSLYNSLIVARPALSHEIKRLKLLAEPMPPLDEISMSNYLASGGLPHQQILHKHLSTGHSGAKRTCDEHGNKLVKQNLSASAMKDGPPASDSLYKKPPPSSPSLQTAFASPTQPKTPNKGGTHMDAAISMLFSKMAKLAAVRINCMTESLKLTHEIREKIYLLFQRILTQKTSLFFNRHVDQILLCCFYVVVEKISNLQLTFRQVEQNYVKQTQCRSQDFWGVFVGWSSQCNREDKENHVSIIEFYNDVFIPNVKSLLEEMGYVGAPEQVPEANNNRNVDNCPSSPQPSLFPTVPNLSPKKVSPSQNVYLSPLRSSKKEALNSHVGESLYAYIGRSTCDQQSPSKELDAINKFLNSTGTRKRRRVLTYDDPNVTLISDSVVAMSLFPHNDKWGL